MWVLRVPATPREVTRLDDLPGELRAQGVELRVRDSLLPLRDVWNSSLHVKRNPAQECGWPAQARLGAFPGAWGRVLRSRGRDAKRADLRSQLPNAGGLQQEANKLAALLAEPELKYL